MAVIAVVGGTGAPGATTTALALLLAWPLPPGRRVLLAECDPDGGAVLAGALEGRVDAVYGLRNLAVADRRGLLVQSIWDQLIDLSPSGSGDRLLLPGLTDPAQAPGLAYTWEPLVEALHGLEPQGYDVILDLGRSGATGSSAVLARRADVVAVTARTTLRGLSAVRPRLAALREDLATAGSGEDAVGLLLIAEGPYPVADISRELGVPALGLLPHAPRAARVLSDGGDTADRRFIRSELMRTARSAVDRIQDLSARRRERLGRTAAPADAPAPAWPQPPGQPYTPQPYAPQPLTPQPFTPQPYAPQPQPAQGYPPPQSPQQYPQQYPQQFPQPYAQPYPQPAPAAEPHPPAHPQHPGPQIAPPAVPQPPTPAPFPAPQPPQSGPYGEVLRAR
ncbi:hypothetical protein AB0K43_01415 [Kitasatospora sp. NPDC049258]|uniref:hypothetical protein n=1 Tax=Kitasatospora sp. NPDC049258 TaxID=3155394 RepID=UPI0034156CF5